MKFYSRYNPAPQIPLINTEPTLTEQSHKAECDINNIVNNYLRYGDWGAAGRPAEPMFGDFTDIPDYRECCDMINYAQEEFGKLPSAIRTKFNNNPTQLIEFLGNSSNRDEAVKLGLIPAPSALENAGNSAP